TFTRVNGQKATLEVTNQVLHTEKVKLLLRMLIVMRIIKMKAKKPNNPFPLLYTTPTYAEKITGRFDMKEPPTSKQIKRFYILFIIGVIVLGCQSFNAHACEPSAVIEMGNAPEVIGRVEIADDPINNGK